AGASVTTGNSVRTGDDTSTVSGYLMLLSGGLLLAAAMRKKRKKING
ncbi:MAG: LPXTG cell wall anchor domain-containing protein, partial [Lachnospiraceae bacterium]|nr:LPXTG cell wall anchor domain-containing protein [Lachnospiraceae bacterium]